MDRPVASLPHFLFIAYGGGHVRMLLPVANRARSLGVADCTFIGLTSARPEVEAQGFRCLGYKDFVRSTDSVAIGRGEQLAAQLSHASIDKHESAAYLGLNYAELEATHGAVEASRMYSRYGRQVFAPRSLMRRFISEVSPDLVIATSAPRSERAAIEAARDLGLPSACLVDLFALDEIAWVGQPGFADRILVLNEPVRQALLAAGRTPAEVVVTGNPAFDQCVSPQSKAAGQALRQERGWPQGRTVLFASAPEPGEHPFRPGVVGNVDLPRNAFEALRAYSDAVPGMRLLLRLHPSEALNPPSWADCVELAGQDLPIEVLVNAVDLVVVLVSTVAVQATLAGCRVLQVSGAMFESAAPFIKYGFAGACVPVSGLQVAVRQLLDSPAPLAGDTTEATRNVLHELAALVA